MTGRAIALAFFDPRHELQGTVRAGGALLFEQGRASSPPGEVDVHPAGEGYRAIVDGSLELSFSPLSPPLELGGSRTQVCAVAGRVKDATLDCLGTLVETTAAPVWAELDALRSLSGLWDADTALLASVRRPRGARGHGEELATAWLVHDGVPVLVEETRLSTVYDASGRQRSAGLELWLPEEDLPRRASGRALGGTSLELEYGLVVNVAAFEWRMDGREGQGLYELTLHDEPAAA